MPIYQAFNGRINAWVKYHFTQNKRGKTKLKITDVKQRNPTKPFKGIPKRGKRK